MSDNLDNRHLIYNMIIAKTKHLNLPLKVTSTAFQLNLKLKNYFENKSNCLKMNLFEQFDLFSNICIFLGCKFEEIHGYLDKIIEKIPNSNLNQILELEIEILEYLDFEFVFTNIFNKALGFKFIYEKYENKEFSKIIENILKLFCYEKGEDFTNLEKIVAAFECDNEKFKEVLNIAGINEFNFINIENLSKSLENIKILHPHDIEKILKGE